MAYVPQGLKIGMSYNATASEWSWLIQARGTEPGEFADDCGTNTDVSAAMDEVKAAIIARLA
tara:strand:+ start:138 stop:323 length:186 start_codon:yes stop_codon:yes gene_type:complete